MIKAWTTGSCKQTVGGWAYLIKYESTEGTIDTVMVHGSSLGTTANQMKLMAVLNALKKIGDLKDRKTDHVTIYINCGRVVKCLTGVYDCRTSLIKGTRVVKMYLDNIEWATGPLIIKYVHIRSHSGIPEQELVGQLAKDAQRQLEA